MTVSVKASLALGALLFTASAAQAYTIDTLEDVPVGGVVSSRVIEGVTVTFNTTGESLLGVRYNSSPPTTFVGAGINQPADRNLVSGEYFIGQEGGIGALGTLTFTFSRAVQGFGLKTIDLLETGVSGSSYFELEALAGSTVIDTDRETGPQGPSGVVVDYFVSSTVPLITSVRVSYDINTALGFGFDDLALDAGPVITVAGPGPLGLFGLSLLWVGIRQRRRNAS